jgi:hypothetical protein
MSSQTTQGLLIREMGMYLLDNCSKYNTEANSQDMEKYISLLFVRDAIVLKNADFLKLLISHSLLEVLIDHISNLAEVDSLQNGYQFVKDGKINILFAKTLLMIFHEAAEVETKLKHEDLQGDLKEIYKDLCEMNIPFNLIKNDPLIFIQAFREEEEEGNEEQVLQKTQDEIRILENLKSQTRSIIEEKSVSTHSKNENKELQMSIIIRAINHASKARI